MLQHLDIPKVRVEKAKKLFFFNFQFGDFFPPSWGKKKGISLWEAAGYLD